MYVVTKKLAGFTAAQNLSFIWGLPGGSFFLASFVFGYFSSNSNGYSFLTLPTSNLEKWLSGVLIAGVLYPLIFLLFYRFIDNTFVSLYHNSLDTTDPFYKQLYESVYVFPFDGIIAWKVYPLFLFLTGAMLLGSLYFNKVAFIKVAISVCILIIGIFGLNWAIASVLFGHISDAGVFHYVTIPVGKEEGFIELPSYINTIFNYSIWYIFPGILWFISYTRLREKEF